MENVSASTVGELLRKTREGRKLSLDEVNKHTKISIETLRTLEQDDIETFESETYLKGFLKNYARFLKLDMDVVMMTLDRQRGRMHLGKGTLWDIEETMKEENLKSAKLLSRILVPVLVLIILILAFLYIREHNQVKKISLEKQAYSIETGSDGNGICAVTTLAVRSQALISRPKIRVCKYSKRRRHFGAPDGQVQTRFQL